MADREWAHPDAPAFPNGVDAGFSRREYAAIHLRVEHEDCPDWLNEMIRKANRAELAKAIIHQMNHTGLKWAKERAQTAFELASAMLAEGKK